MKKLKIFYQIIRGAPTKIKRGASKKKKKGIGPPFFFPIFVLLGNFF